MLTTASKSMLIAAITLTPALAQNTSNTCPFNYGVPNIRDISSPNASVNSTGSSSFSVSNDSPWYLSVLVNETDRDNSRFTRQSFLSVSNNATNASVCLYQFSPLNATATGGGCAGVFNDECRDYLQQTIFNSTNRFWQEGDSCPVIYPSDTEARNRLRDLCGRISGTERSPQRFSVPNDTCNYPSLPGVDLPDGYQTPFSSAGMKGMYGIFGDTPASTYDLYVSQVVPFAVVTSFEGNQNNAVQFVCVTPNNTQPGSQASEDRTPWENAATGWPAACNLAVGMAALVGLMFAL